MNKPLATICVVCALIMCACTAPKKRVKVKGEQVIATTTPSTTPPVPSTPDTAAPIVSTAPPSTTLPTPTTTEPPAPELPADTVRNSATDPDGLPWPSPADPDWDIWMAMGACEQPGNGVGGVNWSHRGPTYQGGLGFWYGTWASYGGRILGISNAGDATPEEQIWVARRVRDAHGYSAWGCAGRVGVG